MKTFTKEFMANNCGCYSLDELNACSFMNQDEITLQSIFESEIPLKDKYWFFCKKVATKDQNKKIAIDLAEMVLPIWEKRYPHDKRPHDAIQTAKQYLAGHISMNELITKRRSAAADAAYAAAYAATYAAANAAYYAADAAAAASYATAAADAASYATAAADAAYYAADAAAAAAAHAAYAAASYAANAAAAAYAANAAAAAHAASSDDIKKKIEDYLMTLL